ncbi:hypothetical protein GIB67_039640 [Kingdonia uniflora]|uniref:Uncharacterized protein n=1 Tax=Kingdonia uniflora TaxID=39325 RepID=A0A7J7MDF9_9MAGN|nr:hypothetical protein GIB67_039640 [Kingdonia uniflora]
MVLTSGCTKVDEVDLVRRFSPVIGVGDEEDIVAELVEWPHLKGSRVEYLTFDYGLTLPLRNLAKSVMNMIEACLAQLNCNFWEVILVCETLNERWAASGSESRITAKDFLEYCAVKYVTGTDGAYLSSSSSRPCFFDLSSAGRVWNDNPLWVSDKCLQRSDEEPLELNNRTITKGISCKVSRKESFIDSVSKDGTELEVVLKKLGINRLKRVASKDDKVRRSQAKRGMVGKTLGSMEKKMLTPELNTPLKLARLNEMPDGPVDMATMSNTVEQNLAKRKAVKRGAASRSATSDSVDDSSMRRKVTPPAKSQMVLEESIKIAEGADLRLRFEVETGLMEERCRAKAREKGVTVVEDEFKKFTRALRGVQLGLQDRSIELEKRISQLEGDKNQFEESLTREREAFQLELEKEKEAAALKLKEVRAERKLYQLRYTKAKILAFSEGNYEEKEIVDEEEVEEMEDGLNVAEKTIADNQEIIDQEIESFHLRVVDLEGLLEVEKNSSADLQDVCVCTLCLATKAGFLAEEYEALISQYEDRLDDNVKLSLKLEEAKRQVEDKTATLLSKDLALNQLISELAELKERAALGSRDDAKLAKYRIRTLNDEISNMKCNIRTLNEQLLKREIDLDTARTNSAVSKIARLYRLKANLRRLKEREAKSRADLADVQAKNRSWVDDLTHVHGNVRRVVQRDKEMNERINQLCARITELERELRVREMKYDKDLKLELDKRDGEIAYGEGSREMKEFLRQKENLVENMRIDLTNSRQKSIDLTRQMSEHIDQLTMELVESKAHRLRNNKRVAVTHQSFKELVVHEQDKCDGEALHQRQLSALVAFFVEEIQFLQVERDLMQDCFFGRTYVCKIDISSIDLIGVMDSGIGTTTAKQIARGREIVAERAPKYMASWTEIGGSSSAVSPTPVVGGRSTVLPSRNSSIIKMK